MPQLNLDSNFAKLRFQSFRLTVPPPQGLNRRRATWWPAGPGTGLLAAQLRDRHSEVAHVC